MLSEYEKELLTAYVDGEMSHRQRMSALRLLHESSEARTLLRDLQENAHRLKLLPERKLDGDFSIQILQEIRARDLTPRAPEKPMRSRWRKWMPAAAAAAAIIAAVGVFFATRPGDDNSVVVVKDSDKDKEIVLPAPPRKLALAFKELAEPAKREELRAELVKEPSAHLDLAVKDSSKAVERINQLFREKKIDLVVSKAAEASLKKKQPKSRYVIYAEGLKPEEVTELLQKLTAEVKSKAPATNFQSMVLTSYSQEDSQKLSNLLGVMLLQKVEPDKGEFFVRAIEDAEPEPKKAPVRRPFKSDSFAVVLSDGGEAAQGLSGEIQAYLASRHDMAPGTMRVMLVIEAA